MVQDIWLFYDPGEDGGWDILEQGQEFEAPLVFSVDFAKALIKCSPEISESSLGTYRISARILEIRKHELFLDCGLKISADIYPHTLREGHFSVDHCLRAAGSFFHSLLLGQSLWERCTYLLRLEEIRRRVKAPDYTQRDMSGAEVITSMNDFKSGWFLLRCRPISGPKT